MLTFPLILGLLLGPQLSGQALESEARQIETLLVAPCCWMQQVSEHRSEAADDVRREVRRMLAAGQSRQEILDAYVARYGKRILAVPPAEGFSRLLYVVPWGVGLLTAVGLVVLVRRMTRPAPLPSAPGPAAISEEKDDEYDQRLDEELRSLD